MKTVVKIFNELPIAKPVVLWHSSKNKTSAVLPITLSPVKPTDSIHMWLPPTNCLNDKESLVGVDVSNNDFIIGTVRSPAATSPSTATEDEIIWFSFVLE